MSEYRTFLVPYDFSAHARAALFAATDLARRLGAGLHLLHVVRPPSYAFGYASQVPPPPIDMAEVREAALESLAEVADGIEPPGRIESRVVEGASVADTISRSADELAADLIVMGTHGRTGLAHVFLGSVAERTLRLAPCPVLTIQAPREASDDA